MRWKGGMPCEDLFAICVPGELGYGLGLVFPKIKGCFDLVKVWHLAGFLIEDVLYWAG